MLSISSSSLCKGNQKCFPRRCYETLLKIKKNRIWTCLLGLWFLVLMLICRQLRSRVTLSNVKSPQILLSSIKNDWALQTLWISSETLITTVYLANWPVYKLEVNFSPQTHLESVNSNELCVVTSWWILCLILRHMSAPFSRPHIDNECCHWALEPGPYHQDHLLLIV